MIHECRVIDCRRAVADARDGLCSHHVQIRERYGSPTKITRRPERLPDYLTSTWDEIACQVTTAIGMAGLEALVIQVYRLRQAQEKITAEGLVVADPKENPVPHPALKIERDAQSEIRRWIKDYGVR